MQNKLRNYLKRHEDIDFLIYSGFPKWSGPYPVGIVPRKEF